MDVLVDSVPLVVVVVLASDVLVVLARVELVVPGVGPFDGD